MLDKKKKDAGPGGVLMSFKGGVSAFVNKLSKSIDVDIKTDANVELLEKKENKYILHVNAKKLEFDKVILSTPAYENVKILKSFDKELSSMLDDIEYSPISVVGLGYTKLSHDLQGFGLLTTSSSKKEVLGVLWDSSIFSDRARMMKS